MSDEAVRKIIEEQLRLGVSFGQEHWDSEDRELARKVTEIYWRPGDPNALASAIMNNVRDEEIELILDGQKFWVRRQ